MKVDLKQAFGIVIKELREQQGLSQQELADYAEMDRAYLSNLERGINYATINMLYKLAEVLKTKPNEILQQVDKLMK